MKLIIHFVIAALLTFQVSAQQSSSIVVATYNLRLNTTADGVNAWPQRKEAVKALIRYHEWDLFGTQEGLSDQIDDLASMDEYAYVGVGRDDGKRAGEFAAIYFRKSRFELESHGDFWLSETPEKPSKGWDAKCCNRIASWAKLRDKLTQRRFFAISVHFDHEGVVARRESAKLMIKKIAELSENLPVICMGDFNSVPTSEPIRILSAEFKDAYLNSETAPYGPVGTFNDFKIAAPLEERIDYIFLNTQVQVLKYAALTDSTHARFPSDHLPVVARVRIR